MSSASAPPADSLDVLPREREDLPPPRLRLSTELHPLPPRKDIQYPTFVTADRIEGRTDDETRAEGNAEVRRGTTIVDADRLTRWESTDEVEAEGHVRLQQNADVVTGPRMRLRLTDNIGFFEKPNYSITRFAAPSAETGQPRSVWEPAAPPTPLPRTVPVIAGETTAPPRSLITATGTADRIDFQGEDRYHLSNATYSTCRADRMDWYAQVGDLSLDYNREVGEARNARLYFKDVPILYTPWLDFSLSNQRKSGVLPPTFGSSTTGGLDITVPYYWNIAPNMDATISPRVMTKRGIQLNTDLRYLNYDYKGEGRVEWMPNDSILGRQRYAYSLTHTHNNLGHGFSGSLTLNNVSDPTYYRDLSTHITATSQSLLLNQGQLSYGRDWWSAVANFQKYKVLNDPALPAVSKPYDRLPQITLTAVRPDIYGTAFNLNGEFVNFDHPTQVTARRLILYPQIALPVQTPSYYVTPKIGYHMTRYDLSNQAAGVPDQINRGVPIFSVDSGVSFEREMTWGGRNLTQTLEPRLYYLYVPTRRQDQIPIFDTGVADLNFATIFSENIFAGGDRIADANQLTAAATSRIIDPSTGVEFARAAVGQRYYFKNQEVVLPGATPRTSKSADVLAALSGEIMPRVYLDTGWQYNPRDGQTQRFVFGTRYQPEQTRVVNASYRYTRDVLGQVDISGQWPLGRGWYGVGRFNYSLKDKSLIESVGGLEYDAGCWVGRFVVHRIATAESQATTAIFFQLELNGLARLGSNPLDILKRSIPGYGIVNRATADPAFGTY